MKYQKKPLAVAISTLGLATILYGSPLGAQETYEAVHVFSIEDLQVDFQGATFGDAGTSSNRLAICDVDVEGSPDCPFDGPQPFTDKQGVRLFPVDNTFGFHVVDFVGAEEKSLDGEYTEGFVGNIEDGDEIVGIKVSNAETDTYKVKPPLGTWCQGLGGTSIKCSTEHYTVMEHVLSCNEVIPYFFANPETGDQGTLSIINDEVNDVLSCGDRSLDNLLKILVDGSKSDTQLVDATPGTPFEEGGMDANDNTTVFRDIAASADYSVTLKDDGKPLYRWGSLIKRPNDIRLYARLELPAAWKEKDPVTDEYPDYPVTDAKLYVTHWITNNPNDQLRPEDLENEAATGRKPSYYTEGDDWRSLKDCFEGDGDALEGIEGTPIVAGTYFKNSDFSLLGDSTDPYAFSSDLSGALTNGYYTTVDRDPFEWSYVRKSEADAGTYNFIGSALPIDNPEQEGLELVSGPRWRLKSNKFGQDIPGLEIPVLECSQPPYGNDNIKYEVGTPVTTVINLLDWEDATISPLSSSRGWVDVDANGAVEVAGYDENGVAYSTNGLPMTEDFDLAVYIKGDRKATALYSARLVINGGGVLPPVAPDYTLYKPKAPNYIFSGKSSSVEVWVAADDTSQATLEGSVLFTGVGSDGYLFEEIVSFPSLDPGDKTQVKVPWIAPFVTEDVTVTWTMSLLLNGVAVDESEPVETVVRVK